MPSEFIPLAEETGLIAPIGAWVVEAARAQIATWRAQGLPDFGLSINLSARRPRDESLIATVRASLARHEVGHGGLEFELTESMLMHRSALNRRQLHALRGLGVSLSIDDFGTGHSSLAYLNRFPIDKLKLDRSFVHDMLEDPADCAITRAITLTITLAIIRLGHTLGLRVVAEGVELPRQAALLREAHCDEFQGLVFGHPMPSADFSSWVAVRGAAALPA